MIAVLDANKENHLNFVERRLKTISYQREIMTEEKIKKAVSEDSVVKVTRGRTQPTSFDCRTQDTAYICF